jgi:anti-sigma regulatory factor (Ser/Thr protein kinase)
MRNNSLDELMADFACLVAAFGEYRPELARRFLGVEQGGGYRTGGRLQNYRGTPPLSEAGFAVLVRLVDAAIDRLDEESRSAGASLRSAAAMRERVAAAYGRPLLELARSRRVALAEAAGHAIDVSTAALTGGAIDSMMSHLAEFAARAGVPPPVLMDLRLVLDELLSNLEKYARRDGRPPAVILAARVAGGDVLLEVADDGPAFDPLAAPPPHLDAELEERPIGGLGLHLVRQLTDDATYSRRAGWNVLLLRRRLPQAG